MNCFGPQQTVLCKVLFQLFTPHLAAEYWAVLRSVPALNSHAVLLDKEISEQPWPQVDPDANIDFMIKVILFDHNLDFLKLFNSSAL